MIVIPKTYFVNDVANGKTDQSKF